VQLAFAISALHTTSEAFHQVLLDLCFNTELVQPLREEIKNVIRDNNPDIDIAALSKLYLLDSVIKESQRLKGALVPNAASSATRLCRPASSFPLGRTSRWIHPTSFSPAVHSDSAKFDGY
jgi:hypothetical protein